VGNVAIDNKEASLSSCIALGLLMKVFDEFDIYLTINPALF
jgi:hypothetical protein